MVSFQTPLSPDPTKPTVPEFENLSKKRKWEKTGIEEVFKLQSKAKSTKSIFDIELQLETPLPLEWQRCLDIQSGQIHFYNTRTHKRTSRDPRASPEPLSPGPMSLELELNLPCDSLRRNRPDDNMGKWNSGSPSHNSKESLQKKNPGGVACSPSWLAFEGDNQEMVAAVCKRCHMLVMLCKSSPACPNCKFMHSPDQTPPNLFKRRFSLLC
ncbi:hypothetical protein PVL29_023398 [Vitis rotundifolia]|uniref:WW domain-containing protein n=1 Tax=Vitis rotundifolia TaxID=103349 RepID=A0AA39D7S5_VITRO|nr:hypothetical protein PVL29_023398 [Vitis rotundifolia]